MLLVVLSRWVVWVLVQLVQVVKEAYQIYLPVEYLAEVEVLLEAAVPVSSHSAVACRMDQPHVSPKVEQEEVSQVKTDRWHSEPEEACQMDSLFHQAAEEVQRVLGFRKTDLCQLGLVVRVGAVE